MYAPDSWAGPSPQHANGNGLAHRETPSSGRGGREDGGTRRRREQTNATSEDGGGGSARGRSHPAVPARPKEHKLWPSPWMRANWDPENPLDFNKPRPDDFSMFEHDDAETRSFQPEFTMDLNELVESLWTPPKMPPPPPPPPREEAPSSRRAAPSPQLRRQRSGSPTPEPSSTPRFDPSATIRDVQRMTPSQFDGRRSVDDYDFRSRRREPSADLSMSHNMEARRRDTPPSLDPRRSYDMEARRRQPTADGRMREMESWSRREAAPTTSLFSRDKYDDTSSRRRAENGQRPRASKDMEYPSSRQRPDANRPMRANGNERDYAHQDPSSRRRAPPTRYNSSYDDDGGYSSDDTVPLEMRSARRAPRRDHLMEPPLRRIASDPLESQQLRPERHRYEQRYP